MPPIIARISQFVSKVPHSIYLWMAVIIGAASSSVTRKIILIGEQNLINGNNPISMCNVLFVGNICAFWVMLPLFYRQLKPSNLRQFTRQDWLSLVSIAILSGAIAPGLVFAALENTNVTNVVLIGRLEPPITLILSVVLLRASINIWTVTSLVISTVGVGTIAFFISQEQTMTMMGGLMNLGKGELLTAIAALIFAIANILSKLLLQNISSGFLSLFRAALGAIVFYILAILIYGSEHFDAVFAPLLWQWMLVYGAIIVAAGQLLFFAGIKNASFAEITVTEAAEPIAAIACAYLLLQEIPTTAQYIGGSIIFVGIVLSAIGKSVERDQ